jgi:hypothetical protein
LLLVAHAALETARDSLFLAGLPSSELPWVYLGVAIVAPAVTRVSDRFGTLGDPFSALLVAMAVVTFGTAVMSVLVVPEADWALYALYIWTGAALTLAMIRFSLLSASRFTVAQAKRVLPVVAFGTSAGGIVGFAGAGALVGVASPYALLWMGAAAYAAAGAAAWFLLRGDPFAEPVQTAPAAVGAGVPRESLFSSTVRSLQEPYVRYLSALIVVAAITVTFTDFLFKSAVDIHIEPDRMASFFATAYFGFSVVSLIAALLLVSPAIRRYGVVSALAVLPVLLLIGSAGLAVLGGISIVVAMKAFDGSLRHSLNKTAVDLLYVPMPAQLRATVKSGVDVLAQRGGQVLGALVILALEPWSNAVFLTTLGVGLGASLWLWIVYALRDEYLELFRRALSDGAFEAVIDYPELGEADLATVIQSLSDSNEDRVLAALELLSVRGHARLIPVAILENESPKVVCEAFHGYGRSRSARRSGSRDRGAGPGFYDAQARDGVGRLGNLHGCHGGLGRLRRVGRVRRGRRARPAARFRDRDRTRRRCGGDCNGAGPRFCAGPRANLARTRRRGAARRTRGDARGRESDARARDDRRDRLQGDAGGSTQGSSGTRRYRVGQVGGRSSGRGRAVGSSVANSPFDSTIRNRPRGRAFAATGR